MTWFIDVLNDRQKKFCLFYLQSFNIRTAAKKAGYCRDYGYALMKNPLVIEEIKSLKESMMSEIFIDGKDILDLYIRIAFCDIRDFLNFNDNKVSLKDNFDGQLVDEIAFNAYGVRLKLMDKFKAVEKLEKFFDIFGIDSWKKFIEEQKLNIRDNSASKVVNVITGIDREEKNEV